MDKLKCFIDTNREAFEEDLLPEGHFDRFAEKLQEPRKKRLRVFSLCAFAAAASIALLFLFRMPGGTTMPDTRQRELRHACAKHQEIEELRLYYNMRMNEITAQIDSLYKKENIPGGDNLLEETKRVRTDNYIFEKTVLPTLPCSNAGLYAMNQHYSTSLESLHIMLKQMKRMNK